MNLDGLEVAEMWSLVVQWAGLLERQLAADAGT
jgi:hypothetical protein